MSKPVKNARIRRNAAETLFSALSTLNIRAALMGSPALALYDNSHHATKELVVLVDHPSLTLLELTLALITYDERHFKRRSTTREREQVIFQAREIPEIARNQCALHFSFFRDLLEDGAKIEFPDAPLINGIPVLPLAHIFCFQLDVWASKFKRPEQGLIDAAEIVTSCIGVIMKKPSLSEYRDALVLFPLTQKNLFLFGTERPKLSARLLRLQEDLVYANAPPQTVSDTDSDGNEVVPNHHKELLSPAGFEGTLESGSLIPHSDRINTQSKPLLREIAAGVLFSALNILDIRAALIGKSALKLYDHARCHEAKGLTIVVDHPDMTFIGLWDRLFTVDQSHFELVIKQQRLIFRTGYSRRPCHIDVYFFRDLIHFQTMEFPKVTLIQGIPVLPLSWILCFALEKWESTLKVKEKGGRQKATAAMFLGSCIQEVAKREVLIMAADFSSSLAFFPLLEQRLAGFERWNPGLVASSDLPGLRRVLVCSEISFPRPLAQQPSPPPSINDSALGPVYAPNLPPHSLGAPFNGAAIMRYIASELVIFLEMLGFSCALFGSMACELYGNRRLPKDLDMLVLPLVSPFQVEQEWIKKQLVAQNKRFFLECAKDPNANYRVLYYRFERHTALPPNLGDRRFKIDILLPGIMDLPHLSQNQINYIDGLPVVPFIVLLLQKLQGWDDHLNCAEIHKFRKHTTDAQDIKNLLEIAPGMLLMKMVKPWDERGILSSGFQQASVERIKRFCQSFPETMNRWLLLGFEVV